MRAQFPCSRRQICRMGLLAGAWLLVSAHTPYRQWEIYRQKHLLIGANKSDPPTYDLGKKIADWLREELPDSKARVARAPHAWRLASLLTTGQIELVLLSGDDAAALRDGRHGFEAFGKTELRALFRFGSYWLICRPDFPNDHAHLVVNTLADHHKSIAKIQMPAARDAPVPAHPAALAWQDAEFGSRLFD